MLHEVTETVASELCREHNNSKVGSGLGIPDVLCRFLCHEPEGCLRTETDVEESQIRNVEFKVQDEQPRSEG